MYQLTCDVKTVDHVSSRVVEWSSGLVSEQPEYIKVDEIEIALKKCYTLKDWKEIKTVILLKQIIHSIDINFADFSVMESALKIPWIQRIRQNSGAKWKFLPEHLLSHLGGYSFC